MIDPAALDLFEKALQSQQAGHALEARELYERGLQIDSNVAAAWVNLGSLLRDMHRLPEAAAALRRAVTLEPTLFAGHYNLGIVLKDQGQFAEAIDSYRRALEIQPNAPDALNNLGLALKGAGEFEKAIAAFQRAVGVRPNFPEAFSNLALVFQSLGRLDEAMVACRNALALRPNYADAINNLGNALKESGRLEEALDAYDAAAALTGNPEITSNRLYLLHFVPSFDPARIYQEHRRWNDRFALPLMPPSLSHANGQEADRRLRIGYVSPYFREHPVGRFLLPLLRHHDRERFEIVCYSDVKRADAVTERLKASADAWHNTVGMTDEQLAQHVTDDRVDILVDLTMHMAGSRLLAFARKPAPVQATYLAYCSTTGLDAIDYRITDPHLDPPGSDAQIYSEKSLWLPRTYWCYQPPDDAPSINELPALANGFVTFGCLNNFSKVSPQTIAAWAQLLKAAPGSRLVLHAHPGAHRQQAQQIFSRAGIRPDRVLFTGFVPLLQYFQHYSHIDIALDPFPYAGGTTTCDALYMGVPVVSLTGATAVSRGGLSILSNVGLPELVAQTTEQYLNIATGLSVDLPRLAAIRKTLRDRMAASPVMDAPVFTRDIENAYRQMWRAWCEMSLGASSQS